MESHQVEHRCVRGFCFTREGGLDHRRNAIIGCAALAHALARDLAWNPAQLEQRVGRVDRLGSRLQKQRALNPDAKLDVLYPLIEGTIDIRLDRTVRAREKWMEFLLGAAPNLDEYALDDEEVAELPVEFAEALKIDLGPRMEGVDALALPRHE